MPTKNAEKRKKPECDLPGSVWCFQSASNSTTSTTAVTSEHTTSQSPTLPGVTWTTGGYVDTLPAASAAGYPASPPATLYLQVCRELQRGVCTRPACECRYAHPPDNVLLDATDNTVTVCMDFVKGKCMREACRYFHPPPHLLAQVKVVQQRVAAASSASSSPPNGPGGGGLSAAGNATPGGGMIPGPAPAGAPASAPIPQPPPATTALPPVSQPAQNHQQHPPQAQLVSSSM